jgi:hypothetical protein
MFVEDAGGNEMQYVLFARDAIRCSYRNNDRMTSIGTALISSDNVDVFAQVVYDLSFAFIAPLSANDDLNGHTLSFAWILSECTSSEESGRDPARDRIDYGVEIVRCCSARCLIPKNCRQKKNEIQGEALQLVFCLSAVYGLYFRRNQINSRLFTA